jgi:hypothetical protein
MGYNNFKHAKAVEEEDDDPRYRLLYQILYCKSINSIIKFADKN